MKDEMDQKLNSDNKYKAMQSSRKQLPAFGMKEAVLHLIKNNQVILVAGATGCGKTTQVGFVARCINQYFFYADKLGVVNSLWMT
jgi:HrpA-like RNA helicase